jgi:hypothetical protein
VTSWLATVKALTLVWDQLYVVPLAPDAGVVSGTFRETVESADTTLRLVGQLTGVYRRQGSRWFLVHTHENMQDAGPPNPR